MGFAKEAWIWVLPPASLGIAALAFRRVSLGAILLLIALLLLFFFRIPRRVPQADGAEILAPANGRVTLVDIVEDLRIGPGKYHHVVTFLSVFDVHVQRSPVSGRVVDSQYSPGRKVAAFRDDAGRLNEQILTVFECANGDRVGMIQIAGLVARRVVSYVRESTSVSRGQLVGLIKFGSRVDLFLPVRYDLRVAVGQRMREGATVVAAEPMQHDR